MDTFCPQDFLFLGDLVDVFLMVITNSANNVGQPTQGVLGCLLGSGRTVCVRLRGAGAKPGVSKHYSVSRLG